MNDSFVSNEQKFNPAAYPTTYTASRGNKIAAVLVVIIFGVGLPAFIFLITMNETAGHTKILLPLLFIFGIAELVFMVLVLTTFRFKIVLHPDRIEYQGLLKNWTVQRNEISSWRIAKVQSSSILEINSGETGTEPVQCTLQCKPDAQLNAWFVGLSDADLIQQKLIDQQIAQNLDLGATPEERLRSAKRIKRIAVALNVITVIMLYWALSHPYPNQLPLWICIAMPWFAVFVCWQSKGLISLFTVRKDGASVNLFAMLMMPTFVLVLPTVVNSPLLEWTAAVVPGLVASAAFLMLIAVTTQRSSTSLAMLAPIILVGVLYGYGAVVVANQLLDNSAPNEQPLRILDRYETHGKAAAGYFTVPAWGNNKVDNDVKVDWDLYHSAIVGGIVCAQIHPGAFHIKWSSINTCSRGVSVPHHSETKTR